MLKTEQDRTVQLPGLEATGAAADIHVGDLVRTGSNRFPHYAVIALYEGMAWVRDVQTGAYGLTSLDLCRKVQGEA
ncbi:MAG: hypothetical protein JO157_15230 [Acetobacteraceae bacterium]|nr:hypothetical protein [Acetobacteraceae bacterium]